MRRRTENDWSKVCAGWYQRGHLDGAGRWVIDWCIAKKSSNGMWQVYDHRNFRGSCQSDGAQCVYSAEKLSLCRNWVNITEAKELEKVEARR